MFHIHTIWLITCNDLKSIVLPETAFGIFSALSISLTTNDKPKFLEVLSRLPQVILWNWLNVLLFDIANQRLPNSIIEDQVNKAWRPIPSGRLTPKEARHLLLVVIPVVFVATFFLGGFFETVGMMVLTWMYNDLGGADEFYLVRNSINALGFMCYSSGSTDVAAGAHSLTPKAYRWIAMVGAIILSTLSMQDLPDVTGDAVRGRRTSPLVMGDAWSRWEIAVPIFLWSIICPVFWNVAWLGFVIPVCVGAWLAFRILRFRTVAEDKRSWQIWCFWTCLLYALPLFTRPSTP
jgi:4-hydroxybenzoate polyprenyltransferase